MSGWSRAGAAAGLLGAVAFVVGTLVAGMPPDPDDSTASIVTHLQDSRTTIMAGVLITVVSLALLLWFLGYFRALLAEAEASIGDRGAPLATVTLVAFVSLFALAGAGSLGLYAVTWRGAASVDPTLVRLTFDAQSLSSYAVTSTVAALSVLARRSSSPAPACCPAGCSCSPPSRSRSPWPRSPGSSSARAGTPPAGRPASDPSPGWCGWPR